MTPAQVFFTDRDLGKKFPTILREGGLTVERHADHFLMRIGCGRSEKRGGSP